MKFSLLASSSAGSDRLNQVPPSEITAERPLSTTNQCKITQVDVARLPPASDSGLNSSHERRAAAIMLKNAKHFGSAEALAGFQSWRTVDSAFVCLSIPALIAAAVTLSNASFSVYYC